MREQIVAILSDEQKVKFQEMTSEYDDRIYSSTTGRIYILENDQPVEMNVRLGLSDGAMTELMSSRPEVGKKVIIGTVSAGNSSGSSQASRGPRLF